VSRDAEDHLSGTGSEMGAVPVFSSQIMAQRCLRHRRVINTTYGSLCSSRS
jgi:hypothetical protein